MELHSVAINGVVSAADAARLGIGPYELRRLCALGLLRRMIRGWYAVWPPGHPLPPGRHGTARARELQEAGSGREESARHAPSR
ncbi:MAG: type IV toxin-antitoxin system AbiEi family antitoxin domain-containing protein [Actinobacteria bacterium]|nr:type IV toxin-antitoxin system AbiEi family antitoxin domain-containing protein [Actinomycetota bacterium]